MSSLTTLNRAVEEDGIACISFAYASGLCAFLTKWLLEVALPSELVASLIQRVQESAHAYFSPPASGAAL